MRSNVKLITSNLILLLLLMLSTSGNLFAQLSADNDGNLEVSPMNGGLKYSYPISNNSIDGYPITVKVNYVDNVLHKQFLDYKFHQAGDKYRSHTWTTLPDGSVRSKDTVMTMPDAQYWDYAPLSKAAWIMGVNGFAINVFKKSTGFIGREKAHDFIIEGYDFCNRMSVLEESNTDVIKILKDDGSVLELRNTYYRKSRYGSIIDSALYVGKYYEAGTNPSGYAIVEYDYEAEALPFVSDTLYQIIPKPEIFKNAVRTRILKYYKGDGLEYVFKEYIVPYGTKWWDESIPLENYLGLTSYIRKYAGANPTIFYLDAINSSEKCLTKFTKKGHDYRNKNCMVYGRVPITEFANHKYTFGSDEATIQVFDKTYRFLLRKSNDEYSLIADDYRNLESAMDSSNRVFNSTTMYPYGYEPRTAPAPDVKERFIRRIIDPVGREITFAYTNEIGQEEEGIGSHPVLMNNLSTLGMNYIGAEIYDVSFHKNRMKWSLYPFAYFPDYLRFIYDNSKVIAFKSVPCRRINYDEPDGGFLFHPISEINHYERNGDRMDLIRSVKYEFSKESGSPFKSSNISIYDKQLDKTDKMQYEYKKFTTIPPHIDHSYINPLKEYNIYLPNKVTTTRTYLDKALNTEIKEILLTETTYKRSDSIGGVSRIHYYPISTKSTMKTLNNNLLSAPTDSVQIQYTEQKYKFGSLNYFQTDYMYLECEGYDSFNQVLISDSTLNYKPSNKDGGFTLLNKQVTNYLNLDLQKQYITTTRYIFDQYSTNLQIDRAFLDGRAVSQVPAVMQPVELKSITYPMIIGIPLSNYLLDAENNIIAGKRMEYNTTLNPSNGRRGSLIKDTIVGLGGETLPNAEYRYHPISKLLVETISPNGSSNKQYYKYSDLLGEGRVKSGKKLHDNKFAIENYDFEKLEYNYETPVITEASVRYIDRYGTPQTRYLRNYFKKTYFGNNSAIIDYNGWLSAFDYDANGRLKTTWLPFDFPTCAKYPKDYRDDMIPLINKKTQIVITQDTIFRDSRIIKRSDSVVVDWDYSDTYLGTDISEWVSEDSSFSVQTKYKYITKMSYYSGKNNSLTNRNIDQAFLRLAYTGQYRDDQIMMKIRIPNFEFEQIVMIGGQGIQTNAPEMGLPATANGNMLRVDISNIASEMSRMNIGESAEIELEIMNEHSKLNILQFSEDSRSMIETYVKGQLEQCSGLDDFTTMIKYTEAPGNRSITTFSKIDDPKQQVDDNRSSHSVIDNQIMYGRYSANTSYYGYENRNLSNTAYINQNNPNPIDPSIPTYNTYNVYSGFSKLLKTYDNMGIESENTYDARGEVVNVSQTFNDSAKKEVQIYNYLIGRAKIAELTGMSSELPWQVKSVRNANGIITMELMDEYGRLRATINHGEDVGSRLVTKYEYYPITNNLKAVIKPNGEVTWYDYDAFNRVIQKIDKNVDFLRYIYDNSGRLRFTMNKEQDINKKFTFLQYDDLGRNTIVGEAKGFDMFNAKTEKLNINQYPYNTNTINNTIYDEYVMGNNDMKMFAIVQTPVKTPEFNYKGSYIMKDTAVIQNSTNSNPSDFENIGTHAHFVRVANFYDEFPETKGAIWGGLPPKARWDSLVANYIWDKNDNPNRSIRNLKGRKAVVAYRDSEDEPFHYIVYSYDPRGRVQSMMRYTENIGFDGVHYKYNSANKITEMMTIDPLKRNYSWYSYDNTCRLDSTWTFLTKCEALGCGVGESAYMHDTVMGKPHKAEFSYQYNLRGAVTSIKYNKIGVYQDYEYYKDGSLKKMKINSDNSQTCLYSLDIDKKDKIGNILSQKVNNGAMGTYEEFYKYDQLGQLVYWKNSMYDIREYYSYDIMGNRESKRNNSGTESYYYENGRLANVGDKEYSYNANGSVISTLEYGDEGTLLEDFTYNYGEIVSGYKKYRDENRNKLSDAWRYRYSAVGGREQKKQLESDYSDYNTWNYYLLGADGSQLAVYKGHQEKETVSFYPECYISAGGMLVTTPDSLSTRQYNFYDQTGSMCMRVMANDMCNQANPNNVEYFDYSPFGEVLKHEGEDKKPGKVGFIGKEQDEESSYFQLGVRQYDPAIGRFLSVDPLWESFRNYNPYHYSYNNPVSFKDPTGLAPEPNEKEDEILSSKEDELQVSNPPPQMVEILMDLERYEIQREENFPHPSTLGWGNEYTVYTMMGYDVKGKEIWALATIFIASGGGSGSTECHGGPLAGKTLYWGATGSHITSRAGSNGSTNGLNTTGDLAQNGPGGGDSNTPVPPSSQEYPVVDQQTQTSCWRACFESILQKDDRLTPEAVALLERTQDAFPNGLTGEQIEGLAYQLGYSVNRIGHNLMSVLSGDVDSKMRTIQRALNSSNKHVLISVSLSVIDGSKLANPRHVMIVTDMIYDGASFSNFTFMDPYRNSINNDLKWTPLWTDQGIGANSGLMGIPGKATVSNGSAIGGNRGSIFYILKRFN